ncbi:hypothetical protein L202_03672 [Cryptococcus amylolentus CBS 6039]|uniref:Cystinosin n=2 Tax=Cryptococcus amylolentus TaxID=104669 RepID=A0A1E3HW04_9TREE|nr:hypothetical protein L202_03672 [Cryptococcus amylolentus CBS 6039]ODN79761.1 hypothetical protein L202_03672 [Cryptococcus amylolentus CBS 6039]ODO08048.1 hypothetical protein I350_03631 [Cryptococcus amylolentus CBS 6273]
MDAAAAPGHPIASFLVGACGVIYFTAWSYSFYPQIILNFQRKKSDGLSPDFVWVNPIGFLALSLWTWGAYFSPIARRQYQERHNGHLPQVSASDLAFSLHALVVTIVTAGQVVWYAHVRKRARRASVDDETAPLVQNEHTGSDNSISQTADNVLTPHSSIWPSPIAQLFLSVLTVSSFIYAIVVWTGRAQFLDWLYFVGNEKLVISAIKYVPQVVLNHRLRAMEGFAVGVVIGDIVGSVFSFSQLVISSVWIDNDPSGIIANPAKLGLAGLSFVFDIIFILQKYYLYRKRRTVEESA